MFRLLPLLILSTLGAGHFHFYGDASACRVELEDVTYYSLVGGVKPAFVENPTFWGTRIGGGVSYCFENGYALQLRDHFCWGSKSEKREVSEFEIVEIAPLDGIGSSILVMDGGTQSFHSAFQENQFDLIFSRCYHCLDGLSLSPGVGYSYLNQRIKFTNEFAGVTTKECLKTPYHGGRVELGIRQQFRGPFAVWITPVFGVYQADTTFYGEQERKIELTQGGVCVRGSLEVAGHYGWKNKSVGIFGFLHYLNYVPSVFNPKLEGERVHLTRSQSFEYGSGAAIHFFTLF